MYLGLLLAFIPPCVTRPYSLVQLISIVLLTIVLILKIRAEESILRAEFSEYTTYASQTKRLIPFLF